VNRSGLGQAPAVRSSEDGEEFMRLRWVCCVVLAVTVVGGVLAWYLGQESAREQTVAWLAAGPVPVLTTKGGRERSWLDRLGTIWPALAAPRGSGRWDRFRFQAWVSEGKRIPGVGHELAALLRDEDPAAYPPKVVFALGLVGGDESCVMLREVVRHKDPKLRFLAACALGERQSTEAIPDLTRLALLDADESVSRCAASAIAAIGGPEARTALESMASADLAPWRMQYVEEALWQLEHQAGGSCNPGRRR